MLGRIVSRAQQRQSSIWTNMVTMKSRALPLYCTRYHRKLNLAQQVALWRSRMQNQRFLRGIIACYEHCCTVVYQHQQVHHGCAPTTQKPHPVRRRIPQVSPFLQRQTCSLRGKLCAMMDTNYGLRETSKSRSVWCGRATFSRVMKEDLCLNLSLCK